MKIVLIFLILISILTAFLYGVLSVRYDLFPYQQLVALKQFFIPASPVVSKRNNYYAQKVFLFNADPNKKYDVAFVGDSLTDDADWSVLLPGLSVANRGIQGDTTAGVLNRLESVYATNAQKVFTLIGTNDILRAKPVTTILDNYRSIVDALVNKGFTVYIQSCVFYGESLSAFNPVVSRVNTELKKIASQSDQVHYIELNETLGSPLRIEQYTYDDVHLTGEAYTQWRQVLLPYLER